jgi:hypothetical protein
MSLQTKEQQIGYILKALYDEDIKIQEFYNAKIKLEEIVPVDAELDNYTGMEILEELNRSVFFDLEEAKKTLYGIYDMKTVQEAGGFYNHFMKGERLKSLAELWEEQPVLYHQTKLECKKCNSHDDVVSFYSGEKEYQLCNPCRTRLFARNK